jgi:LPS sulfotransferase NodH
MQKKYFRFQVTRFIILFVERAGSTYLTTLLNSHPDIKCVTEKLDGLKIEPDGKNAQLEWTNNYLSPPIIGPDRAIGFKTKQVDILDPTGFKKILQKKKCRIIQLQRKNSVKAVISTINAKRLWEKSGNWNLLKETDRRPPMVVDPDEFASLLELREKWDQDLNKLVGEIKLPTLKIYYEDLLEDENEFINKILNFIRVEHKPIQGKTIKHTSDNLKNVIINFDELKRLYINTPYQTMFDQTR